MTSCGGCAAVADILHHQLHAWQCLLNSRKEELASYTSAIDSLNNRRTELISAIHTVYAKTSEAPAAAAPSLPRDPSKDVTEVRRLPRGIIPFLTHKCDTSPSSRQPRSTPLATQGPRKRRRSPTHPKRAMTPYFVFARDHRAEYARRFPHLRAPEVTAALAAAWRDLSQSQRVRYQREADLDHERFKRERAALRESRAVAATVEGGEGSESGYEQDSADAIDEALLPLPPGRVTSQPGSPHSGVDFSVSAAANVLASAGVSAAGERFSPHQGIGGIGGERFSASRFGGTSPSPLVVGAAPGGVNSLLESAMRSVPGASLSPSSGEVGAGGPASSVGNGLERRAVSSGNSGGTTNLSPEDAGERDVERPRVVSGWAASSALMRQSASSSTSPVAPAPRQDGMLMFTHGGQEDDASAAAAAFGGSLRLPFATGGGAASQHMGHGGPPTQAPSPSLAAPLNRASSLRMFSFSGTAAEGLFGDQM